jgi:ABC-type molybdate transport system substrate-binding protein
MVTTNGASNAAGAQAFIDFTVGLTGQAFVAEYGFNAP